MNDKVLELAGSPITIYFILAVAIGWIIAFGFFEKNSIVSGLKGKDSVWQFIEIVMVVWVILFPTMVICDMLGVHPSDKSWLFMEIIFTTSVTGKITARVFEEKYKNRKDGD